MRTARPTTRPWFPAFFSCLLVAVWHFYVKVDSFGFTMYMGLYYFTFSQRFKKCTQSIYFNPLTAEWAFRALIDFTLSNARRFYSSMGNPLDGKGLRWCFTFQILQMPDFFIINDIQDKISPFSLVKSSAFFFCKQCKREVTNQAFWLVIDQRNSQMLTQMFCFQIKCALSMAQFMAWRVHFLCLTISQSFSCILFICNQMIFLCNLE